jgi:3-oxoacyl-[acyl-carrier-protein] synthase-3
MVAAGRETLARAGLDAGAVDAWIPHQANARIVERSGTRLGINTDRWVTALADRGNSSAATIPTALSLAAAEGRFQPGDLLLLTAVGAGLLQAGLLLEWGTP